MEKSGHNARPRLALGSRGFVDRGAILCAVGGGLGLSPVMPGTCGSLPGLVVGAALATLLPPVAGGEDAALYLGLMAVALAALIIFSWWTIARTEAALKTHDDQRIVIDEVAGQALAVAGLPLDWRWYLAAFILFRTFDIVKPGLIGQIDRKVPGALGTLGDDLLAGALALVLLQLAVRYLGA